MAVSAAKRHSAVSMLPVSPEKKDSPERSETLLVSSAATQQAAEKLFAARTVLLFGEITTALSERVCTQLLALAEDSAAPIRMLVHSQGGHVEAADSLHDIVRFLKPEVRMIGTGWVASAAALVFVAAKRENRFALPNTRFLLHEPSGGAGGPVSDIEIEVRQIVALRERLGRLFSEATGQSVEKILADTERNLWMNAEEAREYGLLHRIVHSSKEV